jgi:hypothetical protein
MCLRLCRQQQEEETQGLTPEELAERKEAAYQQRVSGWTVILSTSTFEFEYHCLSLER